MQTGSTGEKKNEDDSRRNTRIIPVVFETVGVVAVGHFERSRWWKCVLGVERDDVDGERLNQNITQQENKEDEKDRRVVVLSERICAIHKGQQIASLLYLPDIIIYRCRP